jgi:hypothetical protein
MTSVRAHPLEWTPEKRAQWIADWNNGKPGLLPVPFHPQGECRLCDIMYDRIDEAAKAREATA